MNKPIQKWTTNIIFTLLLILGSAAVNATYYPSAGWLYYNGQFYLASYMLWDSPGPWTSPEPGYEHDLHVHDPNFFTSQCTTFSNLPDSYDDCPTAGIFDPNGPVFSFGSFDAELITANNWYFGAWQFTSHGSAASSPFTLIGQENESRCPFGLESIWCMFSNNSQPLLSGLYMNWGGYPTWVPY